MKRRISALVLLAILFLSSILFLPQHQAQASLSLQAAATATRTRTRTPTQIVGASPTRTPTNTLSPTPSATLTSFPTLSNAPDLIVTSVSLVYEAGYTGSCRQFDARVALKATIKNIGNADAGPFTTSQGTGITPGLAAGQTVDVSTSYSTYPPYYNTTGVTFTVDPYSNQVIESNETNNSLTVTLPIAPLCTVTPTPTADPLLPDLIFGTVGRAMNPAIVRMPSGCYTAMPTYGTSIQVKNIGGPNAGAFSVSVTSSTQTLTQTVSGLAAGQSVSVWFNMGFQPVLTIVIDSTNAVTESNENNTKTIYVSSGTPTSTGTPPPPPVVCTVTPTPPGPTLTPSVTPTGPTPTFTRTPSLTPTSASGICSPVNATITAPFTYDGVGNFCWQSSNLGSYINNWNNSSVTISGVNITNMYVASGSYPAQIGGFWYVTYNSTVAWSHFEAK